MNFQFHGTWRSLVARLLGVQEAVGSNPAVPTIFCNDLQASSGCLFCFADTFADTLGFICIFSGNAKAVNRNAADNHSTEPVVPAVLIAVETDFPVFCSTYSTIHSLSLIASRCSHVPTLIRPFPVADLRQVITVLANIILMFDQLIAHRLLDVRDSGSQLRDTINHVYCEVEAVEIV